jgi:hypothetical protein
MRGALAGVLVQNQQGRDMHRVLLKKVESRLKREHMLLKSLRLYAGRNEV